MASLWDRVGLVEAGRCAARRGAAEAESPQGDE